MQLSVATGSVLGSTQLFNIETFYVLQGIVGKESKLWSTGLQLGVMWVWAVSLCFFYSIHMWFFPGEIKPTVGSPLVKAFVYCYFSVQSVTLSEDIFNLHSVAHCAYFSYLYGPVRETRMLLSDKSATCAFLFFFHGHKPFQGSACGTTYIYLVNTTLGQVCSCVSISACRIQKS